MIEFRDNFSKPWIETAQTIQMIGNAAGRKLVQIVKTVGEAITSTGDLVFGVPVGAMGSYSYGKVSTCGDSSEMITVVQRRACRILHGSYSWLATAAAKTVSFGQSTPIQHEWIQIRTNTHYYIVQIWANGDIFMERKMSIHDVDQAGLYCAGRSNNADVWTVDTHSTTLKLGNIINWLKSEHFTPSYHWSKHNCQHFCKAFMNSF